MALAVIHEKPIAHAGGCEILRGGDAYFERFVQLIDGAEHTIHLQVYVFNNDRTGEEVFNALVRARRRGVEVNVVVDGVGSGHLPASFLKRFPEEGILLRFFSKLHFSIPFRLGRRMHHKLLVVDHQKAIVGGINVADRYRGNNLEPPWLDFGIYLEGPVCIKLHNLAVRILNRRDFKKRLARRFWKSKKMGVFQAVRPIENDFFRKKVQIRRSYLKAIAESKSSLTIFASYFLPDRQLLRQLEKAVERGVEVELLLPRKSDVIIYKTALKYFYQRLLEKGVKIYEYPHTVLHAKVAAADYQWCTIGSYNLNDLSDLLSLELNVEVLEKDLAGKFQKQLQEILAEECVRVPASDFLQASKVQRWIWRRHYYFMVNMLKLTYWLTDKTNSYPLA